MVSFNDVAQMTGSVSEGVCAKPDDPRVILVIPMTQMVEQRIDLQKLSSDSQMGSVAHKHPPNTYTK